MNSDDISSTEDAREPTQVGDGRTVEVFISYSSHDRDKVENLAHALEKTGFVVWWDRALLPGDSYEGSIEVALKQAKAVIVCWTHNAVASDWVRSEADDARVNGKLLPVFLEEIDLPKPFDRIHTENLVGWRGNRDHHGFQELEEAIRARIEGRVAKAIPWRKKWLTRGAVISFVAMLGVGAANVSLIKDIFFPSETLTAEQVEDIIAAALAKASLDGTELDDRSQESLRGALSSVLKSTDADKAEARQALLSGRVEDAADSLADAARRQAEAATGVVSEAANSFREAGALYAASNTSAAIEAYRQAIALAPDDPDARNELAHLLERTGNPGEARQLYESVLASPGDEQPIWRAKMLGNIALMDQSRGDWDSAEAAILEAMEIFKTEGDEESVAKALINLGQIHQSLQNWEKAQSYTERGLVLTRRIKSARGEATALGNLGYQAMSRGDADTARSYMAQAAEIMEAEGLKTELGLVYINLANISTGENDLDVAEDMAERAREIGQEMNAVLVEAGAYSNLANIAKKRGNMDESELYHIKAIRLFESIELLDKLEQQHRAFSSAALMAGNGEKALEQHLKAIEVAERMPQRVVLGRSLESLARLHANLGQFDEAVMRVGQSIEIFETENNAIGLGDSLLLRARLLLAVDQPQAGIDSFVLARNAYEAGDRPDLAAEAMVFLANVGIQFGDANIAENALADAVSFSQTLQAPSLNLQHIIALAVTDIRLMQDDIEGAFEAATEYLSRIEGQDAELESDARLILARLNRLDGNEDEAREYFSQAAELMRSISPERFEQINAERDSQ